MLGKDERFYSPQGCAADNHACRAINIAQARYDSGARLYDIAIHEAYVTRATREHEAAESDAHTRAACAFADGGAQMFRYLGHESPVAYSWRDVVFYSVEGV